MMGYKRMICPYCKEEVPKTHKVQYTCGRDSCRSARIRELKQAEAKDLMPDAKFSRLGVEILVDLCERRGLDAKEAARVMNRRYRSVAKKLSELKETGAYAVIWKKIQMMRKLRDLV